MAKLVDALCSGRSAFTGVLVRIQFWAQAPFRLWRKGVLVCKRGECIRLSEQAKTTAHDEGVGRRLGKPLVEVYG